MQIKSANITVKLISIFVVLSVTLSCSKHFTNTVPTNETPAKITNNVIPTDTTPTSCHFLTGAELQFCISCFQTLDARRSDPLVSNDFMGLLNQCIAQSLDAGKVCIQGCPVGKTLNTQTCSCLDSFSPIPTTSPGVQSDQAPPNVRVTWPYTPPLQTENTLTSCKALVSPIEFQVTNHGNTNFVDNTYIVETDSNCNENDLNRVLIPSATGYGTLTSSFKIQTQSLGEYKDLVYSLTNPGPSTAWVPALPMTSGKLPPTEQNVPFAGPFPGSQNISNLSLTLGNQPQGQYLLAFEYYLFDPNSASLVIKANENEILNENFSNIVPLNPGISQSYPYFPTLFRRNYYSNFTLVPPEVIRCPNKKGFLGRPIENPPGCGVGPGFAGAVSVYSIHKTFEHNGGPLLINFSAQASSQTAISWGVNFLKITKSPLIKKCFVKYHFMDSNHLSSHYVLKFYLKTKCHSNTGDGNSTAHPDPSCLCHAELDTNGSGRLDF